MTMLLRVVVPKENSYNWRWLKTLSQDDTRRFPSWLKEERRCRNGTSRSCRRCYRVTVEEDCQEGAQKRKAEKKWRQTRAAKTEGSRAKSSKKWLQAKVSMHDGVKNNVKRPVEQSFMQSWDCSHIENEEEKESWREGDQMAAQWDEKQKLEDILERRRTEGSPVQLEVMHNATELFVHGMVYEENEEKTEYRNGGRY